MAVLPEVCHSAILLPEVYGGNGVSQNGNQNGNDSAQKGRMANPILIAILCKSMRDKDLREQNGRMAKTDSEDMNMTVKELAESNLSDLAALASHMADEAAAADDSQPIHDLLAEIAVVADKASSRLCALSDKLRKAQRK